MAAVVLATMRTATKTLSALRFHRITAADFGDIAHFMTLSDSRTCDYTFGGIVLWAKHFGYRIAIADNTLYICGGREDNLGVRAFAMPRSTTFDCLMAEEVIELGHRTSRWSVEYSNNGKMDSKKGL